MKYIQRKKKEKKKNQIIITKQISIKTRIN